MRKLVLIVSLVLIAATSVAAKDWRGILPMHSTRAHVEALLGPPPPSPGGYTLNKGRSIYSLEEGEVYIVFAEQEFHGGECLSTVPAGTVLMIQIIPKAELPFSSLNIDAKQFKKFDASEPSGNGYDGFLNEQEGFVVRVFKGNVEQLVYGASAFDRGRCSAYYNNFENSVRISLRPACGLLFRFDEYGDIRFSDEKARLDNFGIQLLNMKDMVGYIVVYAGQKATVAEAQVRANRARDYLITVRHIKPERVKAIDGGHHAELTVTLWILPAESGPPLLMPTVDPSQVEIIYDKKRRSRKRY